MNAITTTTDTKPKLVVSPEPAYVYKTQLPPIAIMYDRATPDVLMLQMLLGQKIVTTVEDNNATLEKDKKKVEKTLLSVPVANQKMKKLYRDFLCNEELKDRIEKQKKEKIKKIVTALATQNPDRFIPSIS